MKKILLTILLMAWCGVSFADTYYVREDTSHNVSRDGLSYATAWGGWGEIQWNSVVGAGDTLLVCGSHSYAEEVDMGQPNATAEARTTIDGNCPSDVGSITITSANYFYNARNYINFQNLIFNAQTTKPAFYNSHGNSLVFTNVIFNGGTQGFSFATNAGTTTDITFNNCTFKDQSGNGVTWEIADADTAASLSGIHFNNSTFLNSDNGINLKLDVEGIATATDISIYNTKFFNIASFAAIVVNNGLNYLWEDVQFSYNTCGNSANCFAGSGYGSSTSDYGKNIIWDNEIYGTTSVVAIDPIYVQYLDVRRNKIHDGSSDDIDGNGILIDYGCSHIIVESNNIYNMVGNPSYTNSGVAIMALNADDVIIKNNYGTGNKYGLFQGDVSAVIGPAPGTIRFINNTFTNNLSGGIEVRDTISTEEAANIYFQNNILTANSVGIGFDDTLNGDSVHSNNIFYGFTTTYNNISAGANELTSNPLVNSDYSLGSGSPALGLGLVNLGVYTDYNGKWRYRVNDAGAVQTSDYHSGIEINGVTRTGVTIN